MCGIAGIFAGDSQKPVPRNKLERMAATLNHRGPDGHGFYIDPACPGLGLVHTRLAIIDVEGGAQPIANEDESIWVIFNGEIFNHVELRQSLAATGHRFRTNSDTEVLVHLYEDYGENFVDHLNGQFAIALWDRRLRKLILVRDRPGILPLYYHVSSNEFIFGSEIKAILSVLDQRPEVNPAAFGQLMTFWAPLTPDTIFDGIREVEPGQMICMEGGRLRSRHYWNWSLAHPGEYRQGKEKDLVQELTTLLEDATRIRLRADVPVGCYLSGGLDSSLLASMVTANHDVKLRTFSLAFYDPRLDESRFQHLMAQHLGTEHTQVGCGAQDIADHWLETIRAVETPLLRTAPAPMGLLSRHVRANGYKVVLTGEGADEVFGGYDIFKETKIRAFCARQPESQWRPMLLKRLYPYLDFTRNQSTEILKSYFGAIDEDLASPVFSHRPRWNGTAQSMAFLSGSFQARVAATNPEEQIMKKWGDQLAPLGMFNRAQFLEARTLMPGYLLSSQGDRMLMAHSVEGRYPFLDHRVIEFANTLPPYLKMRVLNEKYLLKKVAGGRLPDEILARKKQPYQAPAAASFFGPDTPEYVGELMSDQKLEEFGYFSTSKVKLLTQKVRESIASGRPISNRDNTSWLAVLSTQMWHYTFQVLRRYC